MRLSFLKLLSYLLILASIFIGNIWGVKAAIDATVTVESPIIGEGEDFASQVLGLPWDMSGQPYPDFETTLKDFQRTAFFADGDLWHLSATSNDPKIWLLWPGIENTQKVLKLGDRFPINAEKYKLLSFRMCSNVDDYAMIYWFYGRFKPSGLPPNEISELIPVYRGCHVYTVDMAYHNNWEGTIYGLRMDPISQVKTSQLELDWVRLTTKNLTNIVPISWSGLDANFDRLDFYLNTSCTATNSFQIGSVDSPNSQGTFNWGGQLQVSESTTKPWMKLPLPESIEPGKYRVLMIAEGMENPICSDKLIEIRKSPGFNFQKPSYLSGPDYADDVIGDPWGMANPADFSRLDGFSQVVFDDGVFSAVTLNNDPKMYPQIPEPINAGKYKYATFRMRMDGIQNVGSGWVQRYHWWTKGPTIDLVTTQDMVIYEGWNTYTLDLSRALLESGAGWKGYPATIRFDPEEVPLEKKVFIDYLVLTGDETIRKGQVFPIYYEVFSDYPVTITFYRDTDNVKGNGRTQIGLVGNQVSQSVMISSSHRIFLPTVINQEVATSSELNFLTGDVYFWDTTGVIPGDYYISVDVSDGYNNTTWYSEIPVSVQDN